MKNNDLFSSVIIEFQTCATYAVCNVYSNWFARVVIEYNYLIKKKWNNVDDTHFVENLSRFFEY